MLGHCQSMEIGQYQSRSSNVLLTKQIYRNTRYYTENEKDINYTAAVIYFHGICEAVVLYEDIMKALF